MDLAGLNRLDRQEAEHELLRCCGSTRWARAMAGARPFTNLAAMAAQADKIWRGLGPDDWLEAFGAHPRISACGHASTQARQRAACEASASGGGAPREIEKRRDADAWSREEQAGANSASEAVSDRLAAANEEYEARFGYIFIVCATGKTADEMLAMLEHRLTNAPADELGVAAEEQRKIMQLRIGKLLA